MKNIVVGGGISGLLVAYELVKKGEEVIVIEKEKKIGGLLATDTISQIPIEKFYHHIFKTDKKAIRLIKELKLINKLKWFDSSMSIYFDGKFYPFRKPIDLINFKPISLLDRIRTGLVTLYLQKNKNGEKMANIPAYLWIKKYGGNQSYEVIWKPLLVSKFGKYYKQISMTWLWGRIYLRAGSTEGQEEKLGYLVGSFGSILDRLIKKIEQKGGVIKTGIKVSKILRKKTGWEIRYNNVTITADRIFVCTSNDQMAKMIGKNKNISLYNKLNQVKYIGAVNLLFSTKQDLTAYYWNNINDSQSPFVALVKHSQLVGKYNGNHIYYLGAYVSEKEDLFLKSNEQIQKIFFDYLKKICPKFNQKEVIEVKIFKSNRAQQITDTNYSQKIVDIKTGVDNVYFLNFSQIYPWDRGLNWAIDKVDELMELV